MNTESAASRLFRILHHRSLTVSIVAVFFALLAFGFLLGGDYRLQREGEDYLLSAYVSAIAGFTVWCVGFVNLLKDDRSGYESFRLSVATLLWALSCLPISLLLLMVMGEVIAAFRFQAQ
jgi:hypothetical protein